MMDVNGKKMGGSKEPPIVQRKYGKVCLLTSQLILSSRMNQTLGFINNAGRSQKKRAAHARPKDEPPHVIGGNN